MWLIVVVVTLLLLRMRIASASTSPTPPTYDVRFLKTNSSGAPVPFISSDNPDADVFIKFGAGPMFPSVVEVGSSSALRKVDRKANFYLYYAAHRGKCIKMAWAQFLEGPWHDYNNPTFAHGCGVMPLPKRRKRGRGQRQGTFGWDHVSAPHVLYNAKHRRFVMFFHGRHGGRGGHSSFIATSQNGFDFSGTFDLVDSSLLQGQGVATWLMDGKHRPIIMGTNYSRPFFHDADGDGEAEFYVIGKRGRVCRLPHYVWKSSLQQVDMTTNNNPIDMTQNLAKCDETPENLYEMVDGKENAYDYIYKSPLTEFLASRQFANHPNNPFPGQIIHSVANAGNESFAFANHVGLYKASHESSDEITGVNELEVFFYIKTPWTRRGTEVPHPTYQSLYRVIYQLSDFRTNEQQRNGIEPFEVWHLKQDLSNEVIFEEVLSPTEMGIGPAGDSFVHKFSNGNKYIFFSTGPEGNIYGAELRKRQRSTTNTY